MRFLKQCKLNLSLTKPEQNSYMLIDYFIISNNLKHYFLSDRATRQHETLDVSFWIQAEQSATVKERHGVALRVANQISLHECLPSLPFWLRLCICHHLLSSRMSFLALILPGPITERCSVVDRSLGFSPSPTDAVVISGNCGNGC